MCNVKQFNGEYDCVCCFLPGQRINRVNYYPFDKLYPLKTNQDYIHFSAIADECNKNEPDEKKHQSFFGFFGEAPISKILKVPEEIPFDYMHLVLQGHAKWLLFVSSYSEIILFKMTRLKFPLYPCRILI